MTPRMGSMSLAASWLWWIVANAIGVTVGYGLGASMAASAGMDHRGDPLGSAAVGLSTGAGLAVAQWMLLRRHLVRPWRWPLATAAGWLVATAAVGVAGAELASSLASFGLIGIVVGAAQWLVWRGQVSGAGWWLPASVAGWLAAALAGWLPVAPFASGPPASGVAVAAAGALPALVTGPVLAWLLRQPLLGFPGLWRAGA